MQRIQYLAFMFVCKLKEKSLFDSVYCKCCGESLEERLAKQVMNSRKEGHCDTKKLRRTVYLAINAGYNPLLNITRKRTIIQCFSDLIQAMDSKDITIDELKQTAKIIEHRVNNISYRDLSFIQWRRLTHIFLYSGCLVMGRIARDKMIACLLDTEKDCFVREKYGYYFENCQTEDAKKLMETATYFQRLKKYQPDLYHQYWTTLCAIEGMQNDSSQQADVDKEFDKYINKKRVNIIAPAYREDYSTLIEDIREKDINVFIGCFDNSFDNRLGLTNEKVLYYNGMGFKMFMEMSDRPMLENVKYVVSRDVYSNVPKIEGVSIRSCNPKVNQKFFCLHGFYNMVQHILIDLLHFSTGEIVIRNANLYYAKKRYDSSHNATNSMLEMWMAMSVHDICANFTFTKALYEKERIKCDEMCSEVVRMNLDTYVEGLQNMYYEMYKMQS
ncbi:MAG: hypothetical protein ACI4EC_09380 [Lachnospiraceae bacterium]